MLNDLTEYTLKHLFIAFAGMRIVAFYLKQRIMKKLITIIGMGAMLCMVPACKKSDIKPQNLQEVTASTAKQGQPAAPVNQNNTSMYVMLASKTCANPQKEYSSLIVDIKSVKIYSDKYGWEELPAFVNGWDLVSMQQANITGLNITDRLPVHSGTITKVAVIFGDNNKLVVNDKTASCFKVGTREVIVSLRGEIKANAVNELLLSMDMCGNVSVQTNSDGSQCYVLKPLVEFNRISQKMIK